MLLFVLIASLLARQVEIKPHGVFEFYDVMTKDNIYKFNYNTQGNVDVSILDPNGRLIFDESARSGSLFTNISTDGKIKITVKNRSSNAIEFSYKSPDPKKELLGHLGYIKDVDLVSELAQLLDHLIKEQGKQISRTYEHQKMVLTAKFWARGLMIAELIMTAIGVYIIHKDFVAMFERKQTL